jgi:hypothetical protein
MYSSACKLLNRDDEYNKLLIEIENDLIEVEKNENLILKSDKGSTDPKPIKNRRNFALEGGYADVLQSEL